ncbi:hypothetical protein [Aquibium microcysteis]|uniref:hypothetical protein n=1 Tax=Aquibium microcysteis TaxID=675281 RepID=UPI00165CF50F|nr:hypothetical protein [Aquibium microcysteis]
MVRFKAVWGPSRTEKKAWGMKWMFSAMLMDGSIRGYTLRFFSDSRRFSVKAHTSGSARADADRLAERDLFSLPELQRGELVEGARVTDILRSKLSPEHVAAAAASAITYRRSR